MVPSSHYNLVLAVERQIYPPNQALPIVTVSQFWPLKGRYTSQTALGVILAPYTPFQFTFFLLLRHTSDEKPGKGSKTWKRLISDFNHNPYGDLDHKLCCFVYGSSPNTLFPKAMTLQRLSISEAMSASLRYPTQQAKLVCHYGTKSNLEPLQPIDM